MQDKLIKRYPLVLISIAIIAGSLTSVGAKFVNDSVPIFTIGAIRWISMGIILLLISRNAIKHIREADSVDILVQSLLGIIANLSWFGALAYTQAINSSIMFLLNPILVYIGSVLFLKEPRSTRALTGSLIAFAGGVFLFGAPALGGSSQEVIGNGLLLVATIGWAAQVLHGKRVITSENINVVLGVQFFITGLASLSLAFMFEQPTVALDIPLDAALWFLGTLLIGGVWSSLVMFKGLVEVKAEDISAILYLDPLVGVIGGTLILGETLSGLTLLASGVILAGVFVSHPAHIHRTIYYRKAAHGSIEEFAHWISKEQEHISASIRRFFR